MSYAPYFLKEGKGFFMTIKETKIEQGAEFIEIDCFTCRHRDGMPKLVFNRHYGYGTKKFPDEAELEEGRAEAKKHDTDGTHSVTIFIGHG